MSEQKINSFSELVNVPEESRKLLSLSDDYTFWYRGNARSHWELVPWVHRDYTPKAERQMVCHFLDAAGSRTTSCPARDDLGAWAALMRHCGLPTRLLDWSAPLLIAAYFAVNSDDEHDEEHDGALWVLAPERMQGAIRGMPHVEDDVKSVQGAPEVPDSFWENIVPLYGPVADRLLRPGFYGNRPDRKYVLPCSPAESNPRMLAQQSKFTLHGRETPPLEQLSARAKPPFLLKWTIPKSVKEEIELALSACGIHLSTVYPDMDSLAREIRATHDRDDMREPQPKQLKADEEPTDEA